MKIFFFSIIYLFIQKKSWNDFLSTLFLTNINLRVPGTLQQAKPSIYDSFLTKVTTIWIVTGSQARLKILRLFMKLTMYNVVIMIRSRNWLMVVAIFGLIWFICWPSFSIWIDSTNEEYLKVNMTTGIDLLLWLEHHLLTCNWTILDRSFA